MEELTQSVIPVLTTRDLVLTTGEAKPDFDVFPGLTLIQSDREASSSVLALTISGRMKQKRGEIDLSIHPLEIVEAGKHSHAGQDAKNEDVTPRIVSSTAKLFKNVALSGVDEVEQLERLVSIKATIREQASWAYSWYKPVPHNVNSIPTFREFSELVGIAISNSQARSTAIGDMTPLDRMKLRVVLALMSRPHASLLVVDDIDQVRSFEYREQLLGTLQRVSQEIPVIAMSANPKDDGYCDEVIELGGMGGPDDHGISLHDDGDPAEKMTEEDIFNLSPRRYDASHAIENSPIEVWSEGAQAYNQSPTSDQTIIMGNQDMDAFFRNIDDEEQNR